VDVVKTTWIIQETVARLFE